ncbi:MAG: hypothetical protein EA349_04615 [Halomonadaceae bacterium]|nr:MAG: hypothetical protein EA349_04615 [Halomonadaceae bacterium]
MNLKGVRFRNGAMVAISAVALAGCLSSGSSSDRSSSEDAVSALLTSIAEGGNADTVFTIATDDTIDLRFSTDPDCDWDNVSLCDDGFMVSDVDSGDITLGAADSLTFDTQWFVKAGNGTPGAQQETFTTPPDPDVIVFAGEPVLFFGDAGLGSNIIRTSLDQVNDEVVLAPDTTTGGGAPGGFAADSENGWVYFSYGNADDGNVIDRMREDGSDQERVAAIDGLPEYLAVDTKNAVLYASSRDRIDSVDLSNAAFGEVATFRSSAGVYAGIAWNPVNEELLVVSSENDTCQLSAMSPGGQETVLQVLMAGFGPGTGSEFGDRSLSPAAIDVEEQVVFAQLCDNSNLIQFDLAENTTSTLSLASYSGRGMTVDPVNRDLIYRGSLNTVRRQNLADPDDNEEILDEDKPSFSRSAAVLLIPEE